MANLQNPLFWSFGLGSWFGVRIRVSWLMPLVLAWLLFEFKLRFGSAIFGVLVVSVLLHEMGHILAARALDGSGDEILIWPLGGMAFVDHSASVLTQLVTAIGGPVVNLIVCGLCLPAVMADGPVWQTLNPLTLPISSAEFESRGVLVSIQLLAFSLNWMMLVVNLLPVFPLDGGQMVRSGLTARLGASMASEISIRIGFVAGILLAVLAMLVFKHVILLGLAFLILLLTMQESFQLQAGDAFDDSFMGYDFSQGYTSLEKSDRAKREPRPGLVARWLESRRQDKQRRLEEQHQQVDEQLDSILAKVHEHGMQALSPSERRLLKRASDRYRGKGQERP
jgi:Zn-dependent protease